MSKDNVPSRPDLFEPNLSNLPVLLLLSTLIPPRPRLCRYWNGSKKKRDKQSDSKALECARLMVEGIVVVTRRSILSYLETTEVYS
jgi:hypothetical protein